MSFQDDSSEFNKETIDIGQELAKIKKLNVDKGEILTNFVNCLQTMYKEVAKETDNQVISKKCIKLQNTCKEDQEDYDEADGLVDELKRLRIGWFPSLKRLLATNSIDKSESNYSE